tara:strand:+ start:141 stop:1124 length:984 start_codon:yes stop_codon:yes gene_type:complete
MKIIKKDYIDLYKTMYLIRRTEEIIAENYSKQLMRCPVHLSIGQEAPATGVCKALTKKDMIISTHRSHAHYLAKGGDLYKMLSELHGKKDGSASGLGGSMHLQDYESGIVASVPIVGSTIPIGVGIAMANKKLNKKSIVTIFFGEGATEQGVFFESLNFAKLHNLPILFVCENNLYSVYTHLLKRQPKQRNVVKIAESLGIPASSHDGNDVLKVYEISKKIRKEIYNKSKPILIEFNTYRWLEHCGPNYDDYLSYRPKGELSNWQKKCPIKKIEKEIIYRKHSFKEVDKIKSVINKTIMKNFIKAEKADFPNLKSMNDLTFSKKSFL